MKNIKKNICFISMIFLGMLILGQAQRSRAADATDTSVANFEQVEQNAASSYSYTPMETIPGFGAPTDFPGYIVAVYKFGLWTIGISALLMITLGGYIYLTSAGNASQVSKAKGVITDAIVGLILALVSWLLLYTINPDLVKFNNLSSSTGESWSGAAGIPGSSTGPTGTSDIDSTAISEDNTIDYSKAAQDNDIKPNAACDNYDFSNSSGVDTKTLKSIAQLESSCGSNKGPSSSGACGLMQMLPSTASSLAGRDVTCDELKNNDALSIDLASKYVGKNADSSCVSGAKNKDSALFAGYNSGYACGSSACSRTKSALCPSSDCAGSLAFECSINPGGLKQSSDYAWNGIGIKSKLK